ncbi:MAG: HAMP domain-containing protein [Nitrospirae bacterium]|nr:HAMP domain-containing protein [Nitrospirota bacterium]
MKNSTSFNNISKKFLVPTLTLAIILFCGLGIFMIQKDKSSILSMMDSKGESVTGFVTKLSADYFAIFDFNDFEKFVKALQSDPDVAFAVFYNNNKKPMTSIDKMPKDTSSLIIYDREIKDESGNILGYLKLGYNKEHLNKSINNSIMIIAASTIVALCILAFGIIFLVRTIITRRVQATVEMLKDIAQGDGDLRKHLHADTGDELGELAKWFNIFIDNIREIIATVQANAERVSVASTELSSTAESLSRGSSDQKLQTEQIATAMTQMSQSITGIVQNAGESTRASKDASTLASKGMEVVERTVKGMEKIAETVKDTSGIIEKLGKSSDEIGNILKVINDIAEQTNLLALNAAIEAARAGENGRGFAVVANEVKKLAESTGVATKEISEMIKKIQVDTEKSVTAMNTGKTEVENGVKLAEEAKNSLYQIVSTSEKAANTVRMISQAAEEQSVSTEQVSQNMENILLVTNQSSEATSNIKMSSDELEKLSLELRNKIGLFKV